MIRRRQIVLALGSAVLTAPLSSFAQQQRAKVARIGWLEATPPASSAYRRETLLASLRDLGYIDGKNITLEERWADGNYDRLPALAAQLVQMKVDVIVAGGYQAISAAQQATSTIPIVMVRTSDPVAAKFVTTLARPGRNITGLSNLNVDAMSKYIELIRAALPKVLRVTVLVNPNHPSHPEFLKRVQASAKANGVILSTAQASSESQIEAVFGTLMREQTGALIVLPDTFFFGQLRHIAALAAKQRVPTMFWTREAADVGGLMSYGQNDAEHYLRAASYIDKILKGAKPGDLPIEQATKIELVINRKTANAIGVKIPDALLFRADKVIE